MVQLTLSNWVRKKPSPERQPLLQSDSQPTPPKTEPSEPVPELVSHGSRQPPNPDLFVDQQGPSTFAEPQPAAASVVAQHPSEGLPAGHAVSHVIAEREAQTPPLVTTVGCSSVYMDAFKQLNKAIFPISYRDQFYRETMEDPFTQQLTRFAIWDQGQAIPQHASSSTWFPQGPQEPPRKLVAAIRCCLQREELHNNCKGPTAYVAPALYVSTLGTLALYRGNGLASRLLDEVASFAAEKFRVTAVYAHVWDGNQEALAWYQRKGFVVVQQMGNYYSKLQPSSARVIKKTLACHSSIHPEVLIYLEQKGKTVY